MKKGFLVAFLVYVSAMLCNAEIERPVTWSFTSKNVGKQETELTFTATIDKDWHIYSQFIEQGGPIPTSFNFTKSSDYELVGKVKELLKPIKAFEKAFGMNIAYFDKKAVFVQKIKLNTAVTTVTGSLEFMVCNDAQCLPPTTVEFSFAVRNDQVNQVALAAKQVLPVKEKVNAMSSSVVETKTSAPHVDSPKTAKKILAIAASKAPAGTTGGKSLWAIFLEGLLGGFAAFLMPCIFPMLPLTVSYFTKSSGKKGSAVGKALLYALSIIVIYVGVGLVVTIIFGADALNNLSTNGVFNFLFFVLLLVFAASFLGAFEITLPSSWINKADSQADKRGLMGIFFMAATLALVSFSCTGPIIGTLLVQAATMGQYMGPAVGMFGFAVALSIPFALFAMFPSWMNNLPKSGGWLNSVKVVLGFLELALALKFLSNVDLAYHWNWFDREVFLGLWIVIFGLLGLYLLEKLKFEHDADLRAVSPFRLFMAIIVLAFTVYMVPGLWGAPLRSIAAFLPPQHTQDFDLYTSTLNKNNGDHSTKKYGELFHAPLNLDAFFDYDQGLAFAKTVNKPVMIDFTGHACVNCRKMEADVWPDKEVLKLLNNDYVLIQLYVDDKTELPAGEQFVSKLSGKKIKTIGNKWSDLQAARFNANSQPYYVLLDTNGNLLLPPQGADYNPLNFVTFLHKGLQVFRNK
jgi:thiol:disulfide interchange protein